MFPFGNRSNSQRRDRDQRAKRRTEQKAKEDQNRLARQESQSGSPPTEVQQTSNPLLRGNTLPAYLDLADSLEGLDRTSPYHLRYSEGPSTSGTVEWPTKSRPAVVNIRSKSRRTSSRSPEHPRRSVDSLIQQFSPEVSAGRTSLNTILVPSASILHPGFGPNLSLIHISEPTRLGMI